MLSKVPLFLLVAQLTLTQDDTNPCKSFGLDYQEGGTYFQNANLNVPFTFSQQFEGCDTDHSNNILVDPSGHQYLCTDTPLTPDDTPETSICAVNQTQLTTGKYGIIVLSNNGDAHPIAYQRDFSLIFGTQATVTITPTSILNITITPTVNITHTIIATITTTLPATTTTTTIFPGAPFLPTMTITPKPITQTITSTLYTLHHTLHSFKTITTTVACSPSPSSEPPKLPKLPRQPAPDKECTVLPTIAPAAVFNGGHKIDFSVPTIVWPKLPITRKVAAVITSATSTASVISPTPATSGSVATSPVAPVSLDRSAGWTGMGSRMGSIGWVRTGASVGAAGGRRIDNPSAGNAGIGGYGWLWYRAAEREDTNEADDTDEPADTGYISPEPNALGEYSHSNDDDDDDDDDGVEGNDSNDNRNIPSLPIRKRSPDLPTTTTTASTPTWLTATYTATAAVETQTVVSVQYITVTEPGSVVTAVASATRAAAGGADQSVGWVTVSVTESRLVRTSTVTSYVVATEGVTVWEMVTRTAGGGNCADSGGGWKDWW